jgi:MFS family permease
MISAILSGFLTRKLGRKAILLIGEVSCFFSMLVLALL